MIPNRAVAARTRSRVPGALLVALAASASDAAGETYVILSLIGDHLTVVSQRRQTGSHLDVNDYQVMPDGCAGVRRFCRSRG